MRSYQAPSTGTIEGCRAVECPFWRSPPNKKRENRTGIFTCQVEACVQESKSPKLSRSVSVLCSCEREVKEVLVEHSRKRKRIAAQWLNNKVGWLAFPFLYNLCLYIPLFTRALFDVPAEPSRMPKDYRPWLFWCGANRATLHLPGCTLRKAWRAMLWQTCF